MKWTSLNDLREKYLSFFESKGHLRMKSFPLVPIGDKSLLLINAGMAPLKKYFTGEETPPRTRVTTCQKCVRTLDIDNVGKTARHGTYFEMLGNFSFGDYFKTEAISWSWEFLTECLEIPAERLYPSVYEEDDEAFEIWNKKIGVPAERIVRMGKDDNFWELGSGPCGPCSEIYFDRGEKYACGNPNCGPGCDCDRFIEIWNNVFTQFSNDGEGNYTELEKKNIDTGMGLERLACVMQDVDNLFETDTVRRILDSVCAEANVVYGKDYKTDVAVRVITDHIRTATFLICDGVLPSNEGRGYILRRVLRRAARYGKLIGTEEGFLSRLCEVVIGENIGAYPELGEKTDYIKKIITLEEERFRATIDAGLGMLEELIATTPASGAISGENAFRLYDTFGFPLDLTREIAEENGLTVDEDAFNALMKEQKERARNARADLSGWDNAKGPKLQDIEATEFCGYTENETDSKVLAILNSDGRADSVGIDDTDVRIILDRTPFFAESGGQVGDKGKLIGAGFEAKITDTKKHDGVYIHSAVIVSGVVSTGDSVCAKICNCRRTKIRRNHSAAHLLHAALRSVLGTHVEQAGSYVDDEKLRFDFSHYEAMKPEEISEVEKLVNSYIMSAAPIETVVTDVESAKAAGAMALFGEKYGKLVRMVKMGEFSTELCGGTHAENTGNLGLFKILSESSVAAGVRRIEAVTGTGVLDLIAEKDSALGEIAHTVKASSVADAPARASAAMAELSKLRHEIEALNSKLAAGKLDSLLASAKQVGSVRLITADMGDMTMDAARALGDSIKDAHPDAAAVLALHTADKLNFIAVCGKSAVAAGAHAGNLLKAVSAVTGGKGGGRPDSAASGGKNITKLSDALAEAEKVLSDMLK